MNALQIGYFTVFTKLNIYRFYYVYLLNPFLSESAESGFTGFEDLQDWINYFIRFIL
jgi:hypothetical protein